LEEGVGQEVLIVDGDEKVRRGLDLLLAAADLQPTVVVDPERAIELAGEKFFAVAVIDLDTPTAGAGLALIGELRRRSPATTVLMLASRRHFEVVVAAFRAGAADVIVKAPEQVDYLKRRVIEAAAARRRERDAGRVLEDTLALHEELFRVLLETFKRAAELDERQGGPPPDEETAVLLVDDDAALQERLGDALRGRGGFAFRGVPNGGEALDLGARERFHVALVKDALPDLPGSMVVRSLKTQAPETIVLLYKAPGPDGPGRVEVVEGSRVIPFLPVLRDAAEIVGRLDELREAALATSRERRHHAAFRQQHIELLRRFAEIRQRLQKAGGGK
jgi:DNA-binding NtrC family response regulator